MAVRKIARRSVLGPIPWCSLVDEDVKKRNQPTEYTGGKCDLPINAEPKDFFAALVVCDKKGSKY